MYYKSCDCKFAKYTSVYQVNISVVQTFMMIRLSSMKFQKTIHAYDLKDIYQNIWKEALAGQGNLHLESNELNQTFT